MFRRILISIIVLLAAVNVRGAQPVDAAVADSCYLEPRSWYIKTNGIGWGLGIANVSFEFEVAKHLSFTVPMYYSGWDYPKHRAKLRILAYQPELRYWWRHEGGLFAGVHFGLAWWNLALGGDYRWQDHNGRRPAYGGGVSIGWRTCPKTSRFKFEFSLGAGFYHLHYDRYENHQGGAKLGTEQKNMFLLDNASVSLIYTFPMYPKLRCPRK